MFPPDPRELVEFRAALVVALAPMRGDPLPLLETDERRVDRALIETQQVVRHLLDPAGDPVAVRGAERVERLTSGWICGPRFGVRVRPRAAIDHQDTPSQSARSTATPQIGGDVFRESL